MPHPMRPPRSSALETCDGDSILALTGAGHRSVDGLLGRLDRNVQSRCVVVLEVGSDLCNA